MWPNQNLKSAVAKVSALRYICSTRMSKAARLCYSFVGFDGANQLYTDGNDCVLLQHEPTGVKNCGGVTKRSTSEAVSYLQGELKIGRKYMF